MDDFKDAYPNTLENLFLNHVSLQVDQFDSDDPNKVIKDKMTTLGDTGEWVDADNSHYLEFDIFFRGRGDYNIILTQSNTYGWSKGASMSVPSIFLDAESTVWGYTSTVVDREGFLARTKGQITTGEPIFAFAADAARMSLKDTTLDNGESKYREPQIVKFTDGTKGPNQKGYGDANESDKDSNLAFIYYNYIKDEDKKIKFPTLEEERHAAYFLEEAKVPSDVSDPILKLADDFNPSNLSNNFEDEIGNGVYYGRLQIRIWLEGWDADCFNAVFGDTLYINLGFETVLEGPSED